MKDGRDIKTTRKRYSADFKAKEALEAIRGNLTLAELGTNGKQDTGVLIRASHTLGAVSAPELQCLQWVENGHFVNATAAR